MCQFRNTRTMLERLLTQRCRGCELTNRWCVQIGRLKIIARCSSQLRQRAHWCKTLRSYGFEWSDKLFVHCLKLVAPCSLFARISSRSPSMWRAAKTWRQRCIRWLSVCQMMLRNTNQCCTIAMHYSNGLSRSRTNQVV